MPHDAASPGAPGAQVARPRRRRRLTLAATLAVAIAGAGCANRDGIAPAANPVEPARLGLEASPADWPAEHWWRRYGDPALDRLVELALADGPSVGLATARLARARSVEEAGEAALSPRIDASAESTRQRFTETGLIPPPRAGSIGSSNALQLGLTWELDLFGRNRAALDAALGAARAAEADLQAARVLLATQVTRTWFDLARLLELRTVAAASLAQQERIVALVRARFEAGLDSRTELRKVESGPPDARRQLAQLDERIALARNTLAALTLQPPAALRDAAPTLPTRAAAIAPAVLPADLIGRRADVVAARWRVEASLRERDVAVAQFYPNVNLAAFAGLSSLGLGRWLESGSTVYGAGPAIRLPIFDAGRLRANLRGRTADIDAAVQAYNATLADAARDVADHVASLRALDDQVRQQRSALSAAEETHALGLARHRAGIGNELAVLSLESAVLAQRAVGVELRARAFDLDAGLARALGGGASLDTIAAR
jgi:NodT family efflux transporter outer membrane factor (OMF) lipoprotein